MFTAVHTAITELKHTRRGRKRKRYLKSDFAQFKKFVANRPFAASHSRGTKPPPCWRAKVALEQDKQRKLQFKIMYVFCLSCPSATFALQRVGFVQLAR